MRKSIREQLIGVSTDEREKQAAHVVSVFESQSWMQKQVAVYVPLRTEFNVWPLFQTLEQKGANLWFPRCEENGALTFRLGSTQAALKWPKGIFGTHEPGEELEQSSAFDLMFIPALIVHPITGARMGYGKGFYDRSVPKIKVDCKVSVVYNFQLKEDWQPNEWDIRVNQIVTPSRIVNIK